MAEPEENEEPESHGVHGAPREDGRMQEEPAGEGVDEESWSEMTETGGDAS